MIPAQRQYIDSTLTIYRDLVENNRDGFRIH
jgi:hypothetical protein